MKNRSLRSAMIALLASLAACSGTAWAATSPPVPDGLAAAVSEGGVVYPAVQYETNSSAALLDISLPAKHDKPLPMVVCIHGGGWATGSRGDLYPVMLWLNAQGYAAASVEYRLTNVAPFPAQIEDCKCAIRFLRAHASAYGIDGSRIGAFGPSAGGHLVALLGLAPGKSDWDKTGGWENQSSAVTCVVDWFGPTDLPALFASPTEPQYIKALLPPFAGGAPEDHAKLLVEASPIVYAGRHKPPFLIEQGDQDPIVPASQSQELYDKLKAAGDDVTLKIISGAGHGTGGFYSPENVATVKAFFLRTLQP